MRHSRIRIVRIIRVRLRIVLRRFDRETPEWMRWLTPWGTSLALHGILLLVLGLAVSFLGPTAGRDGTSFESQFPKQLREDITALKPSDHAGDPFTTLKSEEPPSISFEPNPPKDGPSHLSALPPKFALGDTLRLIPHEMPGPRDSKSAKKSKALAPLAMGTGMGGNATEVLPLIAPFAGRQGEAKAKLLRREGGTVESEKAVERGLDWLARHQSPDGSWNLDPNPMCQGVPCRPVPCMMSDVGATGLALLPMLGAGHTHTEKSRYQGPLRRGLFWLVKAQQPRTGEIFTGGAGHSRGYSHAIATMALCEAYGLTKDKRLRDPAQRAVNWIVGIQNRFDGGWRYDPGDASDTSVLGWDIFALRSARLAGLNVSKATIGRARKYLDSVANDPKGATYSYMPGRAVSFSMTAEGLVSRQLLGWPRNHPGLLLGAATIFEHLEESTERNIYYWYYATQLLHNMQGKEWERWNVRVRDGLIAMQVNGVNCDRGSWDPDEPQPDRWGVTGGRLYMTSLSLLTLEVYYRYLPLYRDRGGEPVDTVDEPAILAKPSPREPRKKGEGPAG